jgi:ribonuclease Y
MSTSIVLYIFVGLVGALLGVGLYEVARRTSLNSKRVREAEQSRQMVQTAPRQSASTEGLWSGWPA